MTNLINNTLEIENMAKRPLLNTISIKINLVFKILSSF